MDMKDKSIQCSACGTTFTFTAGERRFYESKGLTNDPGRCPRCRKARKQESRGLSGSWSSYANRAMLSREYQQ